jgi:hypothetical protein
MRELIERRLLMDWSIPEARVRRVLLRDSGWREAWDGSFRLVPFQFSDDGDCWPPNSEVEQGFAFDDVDLQETITGPLRAVLAVSFRDE